MMWHARSAWWFETKSYARTLRASSAPFGRGSKNQKFSLPFFFSSAGGVGGADKKWKGNFWFCFAVSVSEKSNLILTFLFALFSVLAARRGATSPRSVVTLILIQQPILQQVMIREKYQVQFCSSTFGNPEDPKVSPAEKLPRLSCLHYIFCTSMWRHLSFV